MPFDFEEFDPKKLSTWIELINFVPRFPIPYVLDCVCSCYLVRSSLNVITPILSFVFTLFIATLSDNLTSYGNNRKPAVFEHPWLIPVFSLVWFAYNMFPFDIVYFITKLLAPIVVFVSGVLAGRDVCHGIDVGVNLFPSSTMPAFLFGIFFAFSKYISLFIFARTTKQDIRNVFIVLFEVTIGASLYYWLTDLGHISNTLWFDKEEMRLLVHLVLGLLEFVRHFLPDSVYEAIWGFFSKIVSYFIPYYGKTWTPEGQKINS